MESGEGREDGVEVGAKLRTQNGNRHSRMGKGGKRGVESRWGTVVAAGWTGLGRRSVAVLILGQVRLVGRTLVGVAGGWRETHPCPAGANAKHQPTNWRISFPNRLEFRQLLPARFSRPRFSTFFPSFLPSSTSSIVVYLYVPSSLCSETSFKRVRR